MQQKRYWLRGGFLILGVALILYSTGVFFNNAIFEFFLFPGALLYDDFLEFFLPTSLDVFLLYLFIINSLIYFAFGAFLGWLYGKIKNRNKVA